MTHPGKDMLIRFTLQSTLYTFRIPGNIIILQLGIYLFITPSCKIRLYSIYKCAPHRRSPYQLLSINYFNKIYRPYDEFVTGYV